MVSAIAFPITDITDFLYLIGSVFAPMVAVQIADYFILKKDSFAVGFNLGNLLIWLVGFILYRLLMRVDFLLGSTLPAMVLTCGICVAAGKIRQRARS